jgi:hypothetical protein
MFNRIKKHKGNIADLLQLEKPEEKHYYAAVIRITRVNYHSDIFQDTVNKCFTLIQKHEGDANQFLNGIILALWSFGFHADKERSLALFGELKNSNLPVSVILIDGIGSYGTFGNEKRLTVTVVDDNISNAIKELVTTDDAIFINKIEAVV